jgi:hypothetical protein
VAGHRTLTPAMLAHLRAIASLGGRSTARKYGGWASPHATRRAKGTQTKLPSALRQVGTVMTKLLAKSTAPRSTVRTGTRLGVTARKSPISRPKTTSKKKRTS